MHPPLPEGVLISVNKSSQLFVNSYPQKGIMNRIKTNGCS